MYLLITREKTRQFSQHTLWPAFSLSNTVSSCYEGECFPLLIRKLVFFSKYVFIGIAISSTVAESSGQSSPILHFSKLELLLSSPLVALSGMKKGCILRIISFKLTNLILIH